MTIRFVILMSLGVLILTGICCEIANAVDRRAARKRWYKDNKQWMLGMIIFKLIRYT